MVPASVNAYAASVSLHAAMALRVTSPLYQACGVISFEMCHQWSFSRHENEPRGELTATVELDQGE